MPAKPTVMTATSASTAPVRFAVSRLAAALLATATGVSLVVGLMAGIVLGRIDLAGTALATGAVVAGTLSGLALLAASGPRPVFGWASLVLGASVVRMVVALALAVAAQLALQPDKGAFWSAFLGGALAVLVVETILSRAALMNPELSRTESA